MARGHLSILVAAVAPTLISAAVVRGQTPDAQPAATPTTPAATMAAVITPTAKAASPDGAFPSAELSAPETRSSETSGDLERERHALWTSPEMREAQAWVREYGRRSRRFTSQHAEQFLDQLSRKSPAEMRAWLDKYVARRAALARATEFDQQMREVRVLQALERQQAAQESYDAFNQGQSQGALVANQRLNARQQWGAAMAAQRQADRAAILAASYLPEYTWFYDPPLWIRQRYAAAALPGDLPPGDPRNFIRGDVPGQVEVHGPNAGPNGEGNGPNAGPVENGFGGGPNAGPGGAGVSAGPNGGPGSGGAGAGGGP